MKKLLLLFISITLILSISTEIFAEDNENNYSIPLMDNIIINFDNLAPSGSPGERIPISINLDNVDTDFICQGSWFINGETINGYSSQNFMVTNGKTSTLYYTIPKEAKPEDRIIVTFKLISEYGIRQVSTNIIVMSPQLNPELTIDKENIIGYKGARIPITITVKDTSGKSISIPIQWEKNGQKVSGFSNDNWQVNGTRTSTYHYPINDPIGSTVKISFTINPNNEPGIIKKTVTTTLSIKSKPDYYTANKDRVLKMVKEVNVEATILGDCGVYSTSTLSKKIGSIKKGTIVTFEDNKNSGAKVKLPNGIWGWVPYNKISISSKNYTVKQDFDKADKEVFVKAKGYTSSTNLLVWINLERQKINIFKNIDGEWKLTKVCPCTSGKNTTPTERGVFKYYKRASRWDFGKYYVLKPMSFNGGHAMHTRTYTPSGSLLDATMGSPKSQGCVRMLDADVNWLWDNMKMGTTVVVH